MTTISYKDMDLKLRYKGYEIFSMPETDDDTIIDDQTLKEERRVFEAVDNQTFKQIMLEFNSYLLPTNSGIHLSKYSSFDKDKLDQYRNYRMTKSNFNKNGKIDNYYKFFLLLHLMIKNDEIPQEDFIARVPLERYLPVLNRKKNKPSFNYTEMLSLNYKITQNFFASPNLKSSTGVLEYMTIRLNKKPLYKIDDMKLYTENRKEYINKIINQKNIYLDESYVKYDLKAPGVKTGFLGEERFVINETMFYHFNHYMFNKKAKIRNYYYKNLFEKIQDCFTDNKYDFIPSNFYLNKKGEKIPLCMIREYSFEIKDKIARYNVEQLLHWFLNFYNYYNYLPYRNRNLLMKQNIIDCSDFFENYNPFKKDQKNKEINMHKIIDNNFYQKINQNENIINICRIYDFDTNKDYFIDYNDKIFNKNKFDYDRLYTINLILILKKNFLIKFNYMKIPLYKIFCFN